MSQQKNHKDALNYFRWIIFFICKTVFFFFSHPCLVWKLLPPVAPTLSVHTFASMICASVTSFSPVFAMVLLKGFRPVTYGIHTPINLHMVLTRKYSIVLLADFTKLVAFPNVDWSV